MKVLITGSSGFLGNVIYTYLDTQFGNIKTLGRNKSCVIQCDLAKQIPDLEPFDLVIHVAGKAHISPKNENENQDFFNVNVRGTKNLLEGIANYKPLPKAFVYISSVSVYGCQTGIEISEECELRAQDSYGLSKIESERLILDWGKNNSIITTILRLPLVVGTNPPGNLGMMINAIKKGYYIRVDKGLTKRSMVLAQDVAEIIPIAYKIGGTYNLTDGVNHSFIDLEKAIQNSFFIKRKIYSIPLKIIKPIAKFGDFYERITNRVFPINSNKLTKVTSDLTFSDNLARKSLLWNPNNVLDHLT